MKIFQPLEAGTAYIRQLRKKHHLIGLALLLLVGCGHQEAEKIGKQTFSEVKKFDRLMDKTIHKISYHDGFPGGHLSWIGKGIVYGKYYIYMKFDVVIDACHRPVRMSGISYNIFEFGTVSATSESLLGILSQEQWDQVETIDDVFKILGHVPIKDKPDVLIEESLRF